MWEILSKRISHQLMFFEFPLTVIIVIIIYLFLLHLFCKLGIRTGQSRSNKIGKLPILGL